jgi:hypothetical protein
VKRTFRLAHLLCALALAGSFLNLRADIAPELREEGILYFDQNLPGRIFATVHSNTTIYIRRNFQTALGAAYPGQKIELLGMAPDGYLVKTQYRNNTITGWLQPQDLPSGINPSIFDEAKKNQQRRDTVAVAIANKNVIQGMSPEEVKQAVGKPDQVTTRTDPNGESTVWTYTTYREDPQYEYSLNAFGQPVLQTYYVKVPIGQLVVAFGPNGVASITQRKSDPNGAGIVTN